MPSLIGNKPNQVPSNGDLGTMAFRDQTQFYDTSRTVGFRNRLINGAMVIDQRNAGASGTAASYTVDRWQFYAGLATKGTWQQNAGSVTPPVGFVNYLGFTSNSAYSVSAGDYFTFVQLIEGYNIADLNWGTANAKTVTLSFQVYSSLTGTFGGSLKGASNTRSYPFTYSIPVANTWTTVSVTVAGCTDGTWLTTNGIGLWACFGLGVGSTYSTTAGSWATGNYLSATGATSVVGTNGATFYITGVQLEVGSSATGYEYVNYQTSLANCQRYYDKSYNITTVPGTATGVGQMGVSGNGSPYGEYMQLRYRTTMRVTPTITLYSPATGASGYVRNNNSSIDVAASVGGAGDSGFASLGIALAAATNYVFHYTATAEL